MKYRVTIEFDVVNTKDIEILESIRLLLDNTLPYMVDNLNLEMGMVI
jgi:hypothetical protein